MSLLPTFAALLAGDPVLFNSSQPCEAAIIPRTGSGGLELAAIVDSIPALLAGDPVLVIFFHFAETPHFPHFSILHF
jgi:hypothetical protein